MEFEQMKYGECDCGGSIWIRVKDGHCECIKCGLEFDLTADGLERFLKVKAAFEAHKAETEGAFVLDDPEKLQEGDGKMIEELATAIMLDGVAEKPKNVIHHGAICCELNELYEKKNRDYGDSFHKTYLEEGMAMARIRLTDKLERFKKLTREGGQEVKDESIRDTLIDLANYAIMTVMEMDRESAE